MRCVQTLCRLKNPFTTFGFNTRYVSIYNPDDVISVATSNVASTDVLAWTKRCSRRNIKAVFETDNKCPEHVKKLGSTYVTILSGSMELEGANEKLKNLLDELQPDAVLMALEDYNLDYLKTPSADLLVKSRIRLQDLIRAAFMKGLYSGINEVLCQRVHYGGSFASVKEMYANYVELYQQTRHIPMCDVYSTCRKSAFELGFKPDSYPKEMWKTLFFYWCRFINEITYEMIFRKYDSITLAFFMYSRPFGVVELLAKLYQIEYDLQSIYLTKKMQIEKMIKSDDKLDAYDSTPVILLVCPNLIGEYVLGRKSLHNSPPMFTGANTNVVHEISNEFMKDAEYVNSQLIMDLKTACSQLPPLKFA